MKKKKLVPLTDEEFKEVYDEIMEAYDKNLKEEMAKERELDPKLVEVLNAETTEEAMRLYKKYFGEMVMD